MWRSPENPDMCTLEGLMQSTQRSIIPASHLIAPACPPTILRTRIVDTAIRGSPITATSMDAPWIWATEGGSLATKAECDDRNQG